MLNFTDTAKERVAHFLEVQRAQGVTALRVAGTRAEQKLWLVKPDDRRADDKVFDAGEFEVYLDPLTAVNLEGATVDFVAGVMQSGFRVYYPSPTWDDPLAQSVQDVIDTVINPGVAGHGGNVELEKVEGDAAFIRFGGGCQGCGAANITLRQGIERIIREQVPGVSRVVDVTDHESGENPYYTKEEVQESPLA